MTSQVMTALCKYLGVERTQTSVYHPQGNGQVKHFNRTLEAMLSKVVRENQKDWDLHILKVLFAYQPSFHESTGCSPFRINFGRSPSLPVNVMLGRVPPSDEAEGNKVPEFMEEVCRSLKTVYKDVRQKLNEAHQQNKTRHDRKTAGNTLHVGDRV